MPLYVFRYKRIGGRPTPMLTFGLQLEEQWYPLEAYVDSGAAYTVLHASTAEGAGFNYQQGRRVYLQVGDGGFIPIYLHELPLQIGRERFCAKVGFSDRLGVAFNLLGREGVFDRFRVCFHERQRLLSLESDAVWQQSTDSLEQP